MSEPSNDAEWAKIDKGVPMPARDPAKRKSLYPFAIMEVGDSFFSLDKRGKINSCAHYYKTVNPGTKFEFRGEDDGVRCWRTA